MKIFVTMATYKRKSKINFSTETGEIVNRLNSDNNGAMLIIFALHSRLWDSTSAVCLLIDILLHCRRYV